jgi:hypothetical protein
MKAGLGVKAGFGRNCEGVPLHTPPSAQNISFADYSQAAAQQTVPSDDILAASITQVSASLNVPPCTLNHREQLFYELDVDMIKSSQTLSGCCCVAAACVASFPAVQLCNTLPRYAAPLMIVVSCGDCRCSFIWCRLITQRLCFAAQGHLLRRRQRLPLHDR